jgi:predicted transcriptional regulator
VVIIIQNIEESVLTASSKGETDHKERLEKVQEFIGQLDSPWDTRIEKLKYIFDLLDNQLVEEYEKELKWVEEADLESNCISGLNNRRSELEILSFILKISRAGANKTKILYRANLSYSQLRNYLGFLKDGDFLKEEGKSKRRKQYITTPKGDLFLYHWSKILNLFKPNTLEDQTII